MTIHLFERLSPHLATHQHVRQWLEDFQAAVQSERYDAGRELFHEQVTSFGTITERANSLDELMENQWKLRWPQNVDFTFTLDDTVFLSDGNGGGTVLTLWTTKQDSDHRHGRATLLLQQRDGKLQCVHSHFSLVP